MSIPLAGLTPGATCHFRVVARNGDGTTTGTDATFTTPALPTGGPASVTLDRRPPAAGAAP